MYIILYGEGIGTTWLTVTVQTSAVLEAAGFGIALRLDACSLSRMDGLGFRGLGFKVYRMIRVFNL